MSLSAHTTPPLSADPVSRARPQRKLSEAEWDIIRDMPALALHRALLLGLVDPVPTPSLMKEKHAAWVRENAWLPHHHEIEKYYLWGYWRYAYCEKGTCWNCLSKRCDLCVHRQKGGPDTDDGVDRVTDSRGRARAVFFSLPPDTRCQWWCRCPCPQERTPTPKQRSRAATCPGPYLSSTRSPRPRSCTPARRPVQPGGKMTTPAIVRTHISNLPPADQEHQRKADKRARYRDRRTQRRRAALFIAGAHDSYSHKDKRLTITAQSGEAVHRIGKHIASLSVAEWIALVDQANTELGLDIQPGESPPSNTHAPARHPDLTSPVELARAVLTSHGITNYEVVEVASVSHVARSAEAETPPLGGPRPTSGEGEIR